jgi:hypothetical protein
MTNASAEKPSASVHTVEIANAHAVSAGPEHRGAVLSAMRPVRQQVAADHDRGDLCQDGPGAHAVIEASDQQRRADQTELCGPAGEQRVHHVIANCAWSDRGAPRGRELGSDKQQDRRADPEAAGEFRSGPDGYREPGERSRRQGHQAVAKHRSSGW